MIWQSLNIPLRIKANCTVATVGFDVDFAVAIELHDAISIEKAVGGRQVAKCLVVTQTGSVWTDLNVATGARTGEIGGKDDA